MSNNEKTTSTGAPSASSPASTPPAPASESAPSTGLPPLAPIHPVPGPAGFAPPSAQGSLGRPVPTPAPSAAAQAASTPTPAPSAPWSDAAAAQFAAPGHHAAQTHGPRSSRDRRFWPAVVGSAAAAALVASVATAGILSTRDDASAVPTSGSSITQTSASQTPQIEGATSWQDVVEQVAGSVVAITVSSGAGGAEGSGVIFDANGLVLTNNHVIEGGVQGGIDIVLADGRVLAAEVVGTDETTDLGVLRITDPPSDLVAATLGDSDSLRVGQGVMAVGNPLGLAGTVTTGIVSALDRPTVTQGSREAVVTNAIQVDAAVNPGNSGGPLFDSAGRVIGINSSIATLSGGSRSGSIGLGFAIPVNLAKQVADQLVATGSVSHAFLGVSLADGTAEVDGVERQGAVVGQVVDGSPAQAAGVQDGDVITAIDGKPVASAQSLTGYVRARTVGQVSTLTIVRGGQSLDVTVTLAARDEPDQLRG